MAEAPAGRLVVVTVQLVAVPLTVKPVGKVILSLASVPVVVAILAQIVPPVAVEAVIRSSRKKALLKLAALAGEASRTRNKKYEMRDKYSVLFMAVAR